MSDPVERADIEDVLSSIRRLVSEEPVRRKPEPVAEEPGKLVLTPAFRVIESDESAQAEAGTGEAVERAQTAEAGTEAETWEEISLEDRIAELEAAVAGRDDEWEPDGSEVAPQNLTFDELEETAEMPVFSHHAAESAQAAPDDEVEAIAAAAMPRFHHAAAPGADGMPQADDADEQAAGTDFPEMEDDTEEAAAEPEMRVASDWSAAAPLEDSGDDDARAEAPRAAEPEEEAANAFGLFETDTSVIDEDMLRELVSDIVREELQGALGERITRNVRKLVRREINRALASRDFD